MNVQITLALFLVASVISLQGDGNNETARKHYGLSFHSKCIDYVKSFTCMTTCKSIGFRVFRLDFRCTCSCHELKTTTILPFYKWRTNGTTKTLPSTQSPNLYHIAGTISPPTPETTTPEIKTTPAGAITCEPPKDNNEVNATNVDDPPNTNNSEAITSKNETSPGNDEKNPSKADDTPTEKAAVPDAPQNPTEAVDTPTENPTAAPDVEP